jgi:regulator of cell morphogenesis and NO signaling
MNGHSDRDGGIDTLCESIVERHHASLREALARIGGLLAHLEEAAAGQLASVRIAFEDVAEQVNANLAKEEYLLFPAIESLAAAEREQVRPPPLPFVTLLHPIRVMETDHARIEQAIDQLCQAAREVGEPFSLLPAWQRCLTDLAALDADVRAHHCTENEVLFPRALELERRAL